MMKKTYIMILFLSIVVIIGALCKIFLFIQYHYLRIRMI